MSMCVYVCLQFSCSVVSNSLRPHEPQHTRTPCPSSTPGVHPNPCSLHRCCHPTISSSVVPFSSCPQSFPASVSFQMSQLFTSGGQSIGVCLVVYLKGLPSKHSGRRQSWIDTVRKRNKQSSCRWALREGQVWTFFFLIRKDDFGSLFWLW